MQELLRFKSREFSRAERVFPKLDTERETSGTKTLSPEGGKKVVEREEGQSAGEWKGRESMKAGGMQGAIADEQSESPAPLLSLPVLT